MGSQKPKWMGEAASFAIVIELCYFRKILVVWMEGDRTEVRTDASRQNKMSKYAAGAHMPMTFSKAGAVDTSFAACSHCNNSNHKPKAS